MRPLGEQLRSPALRYRWPAGRSPSGVTKPAALGVSSAGAEPNAKNQPPPGRRSRLEAVLLLAREPLTLRRLAQLADLEDATEARTLLGELSRAHDRRGSAFGVERVAGGYQLLTREKLAPWVEKFSPGSGELGLSAAAMETLAVVAYRQPVPRAEIEAIRGVQSSELLRQLMDRDILRIVGRSEELGRPLLYGTTKRFLQVFGLNRLEELPPIEAGPATEPADPPPPNQAASG